MLELRIKIEEKINEKIKSICKGENSDEQFNILVEKFKINYDKLEDDDLFTDEYMKQKYVLNMLFNRYGRVPKWWVLNSLLDIKTDWRAIV